jgi:hypothetical protein
VGPSRFSSVFDRRTARSAPSFRHAAVNGVGGIQDAQRSRDRVEELNAIAGLVRTRDRQRQQVSFQPEILPNIFRCGAQNNIAAVGQIPNNHGGAGGILVLRRGCRGILLGRIPAHREKGPRGTEGERFNPFDLGLLAGY